ncbi:hypothetical protein CMV_008528 [Castanea mollissima]|uniref:DDE Tnp4 domain-containing protein n=1 Tax=Castanea mollissima TaxID=60419 RepID=A0A8J4RLN4_9ROSI|nr:hypothetical protein CMV_008528 [Castanea mollissima]
MYAYMQHQFDKQPMRTSTLTGRAYMDEITEGNPAKCYKMFRMTPELLEHLVDELARHGYLRDGQGGPWFKRRVGAIDGTHVIARPPANAAQAHRSYKSTITTNVLKHTGHVAHICPCWVEGSANDSRVLKEAIGDRKHGFPWPPTGSYYLVDSGLPIGTRFLPPHKLTRYHAQEFHSSSRQPTSKKELYNYRHPSLQMVIAQSFGVLKACFPILNLMPNFKQTRQCYVIVVCCALHNFICMNNRSDELFRIIGESVGEGSATNNEGSVDTGAATSSATQRRVLEMSDASKRMMGQFRDNITDVMWDGYVARGN